jgi:hypothetical protein
MCYVISHVRRVLIGDDIPTVFEYLTTLALTVGVCLITVGP